MRSKHIPQNLEVPECNHWISPKMESILPHWLKHVYCGIRVLHRWQLFKELRYATIISLDLQAQDARIGPRKGFHTLLLVVCVYLQFEWQPRHHPQKVHPCLAMRRRLLQCSWNYSQHLSWTSTGMHFQEVQVAKVQSSWWLQRENSHGAARFASKARSEPSATEIYRIINCSCPAQVTNKLKPNK